ncbi:hypothetical protein OPQ81_009157 [Rhizoctonia solani]|nr:hypothetical protein OPQ81_009157 [Rhizoctonia solani]
MSTSKARRSARKWTQFQYVVSAGCATCEARNKKCDRTRGPNGCRRCEKAGIECGGYLGARIPKPKHSLRNDEGSTSTRAMATPTSSTSLPDLKVTSRSVENSCAITTDSKSLGWSDSTTIYRMSAPHTRDFAVRSLSLIRGRIPTGPDPIPSIQQITTSIGQIPGPPVEGSVGTGAPELRGGGIMTAGQASIFDSIFSLADNAPIMPPTLQTPGTGIGARRDLPSERAQQTEPAERWPVYPDGDFEIETAEFICSEILDGLALDRHVESNMLPFIVHSFSSWMSRFLFEPTRVIAITRDHILRGYSTHPARHTMLLISNAALSVSSSTDYELADFMTLYGQLLDSVVKVRARSDAELTRELALGAMQHSHEFISTLCRVGSLASVLKVMDLYAPIFRRACPEPSEVLVNLPRVITTINVHLQFYATLDVLQSDEELLNAENGPGLRWLYGVPDPLMVTLARMNTLLEDFGGYLDVENVRELEKEIGNFVTAVHLSSMTDLTLNPGRVLVQESWRLAAYVYLYMGLCGVNCLDARVLKVQKMFMKLLETVSSRRNPDSFLVLPIVIVWQHPLPRNKPSFLAASGAFQSVTEGNEILLAKMSRSRGSARSTTGCTFCKARRKKCDETKPQCLRCQASGRRCAYEYVEYPESEAHRIKRTKPGPRTTSEQMARALANAPFSPSGTSSSSLSTHSRPGESTTLIDSFPSKTWNKSYNNRNLARPRGVVDPLPLSSINPVPSQRPSDINSLNTSLISRGHLRFPISVTGVYDSSSTSRTLTLYDLDEDDKDDDDPEGVRVLLCISPTVDKNVKENSLPFVLNCYARWAIARVFEPLKVVHALRDQVIDHFSSEDTRARTILIANVMVIFAKNLVVDSRGKSILNHLVLTVRSSGSTFMATPPSFVPAQDRQNAMCILDSMLEIFSLQTSTQSSAACLQLLDDAAPVFRRACSEPPGKLVNLPNILLTPSLNLRHFATIDIMKSVNTGRATYFQYEVPFSLELCEQMYQMQERYSLQWLHGSPDQFVLLLAWINSLCETPGARDNPKLITWIETNLPLIKVAVNESNDPSLRICRMMVQECWRFAVLIYLHMALCRASAWDPRVVRAQKGFMRLLRGVKPNRHPDAYLYTPVVVAGIATIEERDRDTLRQRMLNVRECAERGTTGNDILVMLEDVWARTRGEGRAAVWSDLRVANEALLKRQLNEMNQLRRTMK